MNRNCISYRIIPNVSIFHQSKDKKNTAIPTQKYNKRSGVHLSARFLDDKENQKCLTQPGQKLSCKINQTHQKTSYLTIAQIVLKELSQQDKKNSTKIISSLSNSLKVIYSLEQNIFDYKAFQMKFHTFQALIHQTYSHTLKAKCLYLGGLWAIEFNSFTLAILYFTKALRSIGEIKKKAKCIVQIQMQIYKNVAKIFLQKCKICQALQFAVKFLRKSWLCESIQSEIQAYDLLGRIQHENQQIQMTRYFHERMCQGQTEKNQIKKLSNLQFKKSQITFLQSTNIIVNEDIYYFIKKDVDFQQTLLKMYKQQCDNYCFHSEKKLQQYNLTHRSPNRVIKNYYTLEKKIYYDFQSKEIHLLKPIQARHLKKIFQELQQLIGYIKRTFEKRCVYGEFREQDFT